MRRRDFLAMGAAAASSSAFAGSVDRTAEVAREFPDRTVDVIVAGSGAAGCAAALAAHEAGASVLLLEKSGVFGGTSAKSGGAYWIPNNAAMKARGLTDPKPDFLRFIARYSYPDLYRANQSDLGLPQHLSDLLGSFYDNAAPVIQSLESMGALSSREFTAFGSDQLFPDYLEHVPENKAPAGRVMGPRNAAGGVGVGDELMSQLRSALETRGIPILMHHRVTGVTRDREGRVRGVEVATPAATVHMQANSGVVFGTGGFAHNKEFLQQFHTRQAFAGCAVPSNTGDFLKIGLQVGARLGNMGGAWRAQVVLEEALQYVSVPNDVWIPAGDSMIIVNHAGQRIVNEKRNYHDRTKAMYAFDANEGRYPNLINFFIYDDRVAERFAGTYPLPEFDGGADYVISADSIDQLTIKIRARLAQYAAATGDVVLDERFAGTLAESIERFNVFADEGVDRDYGRGSYAYDRTWALANPGMSGTRWPANDRPNPTMYPINRSGKLYAIILAPGILDTNGGPVIDARSQVLDLGGRPIPSLFAAGNCVASPAGDSYWGAGAGATIGAALTFGFIAGRNAARSNLAS